MAAAAALAVAMLLIAGLVAMATGLRDGGDEEAEIAGLVEAIAAESAAVTNGYFAGPESVAHVMAGSLESEPSSDAIIDLLRNLTAAQANVIGTFVGYPDGGFVDVRREDGRFRVKTIERDGNERFVKVDVVDPELGSVATFSIPNDTYDPRTRPWYQGVEGTSAFWTEPYVFFTSQEPGVTYSVPVLDQTGSMVAVVGVDIRLTDLHDFLEGRRPSENGGAAVINSRGELVAGATQLLETVNGQAAIEDLLDERQDDQLQSLRVVDDAQRVVVGTPVGAGGTKLLVVDAPNNDFLEQIRSTRRDYALLATALGIVGILLLGLGARLIGQYLETLGHLARTDPLTGLLNRSSLSDQISTALERGSNLAVMAVDLDDFKLVNDQFGHDGGDRALTRVAQQFQESAPTGAILARLGGDEFCIVLTDSNDALSALRSIVHAAAGPVVASDYTFDLALSAGYTLSNGERTETAETLFRRADIAMYEAKEQRGTAIVEFDKSMHMQWEHDDEQHRRLTSAIANGQMVVHFQPELNLRTNQVVGAEAFLRWDDPTNGLTPAAEFIDDLERFGLLTDLRTEIFSQAEELAAAVSSAEPLTIRMNVSTRQLLDPTFIDDLERLIARSAATWCLELSGQTVADSNPKVRASIDRARELGALIALDNFGSGALPLAELPHLPVDLMKIDRELVSDLTVENPSQSIAGVLTTLASVAGLELVAQGVETAEQRDALLALGCERAQGYFLGRPVSLDAFAVRWGEEVARSAA